MRYIGLGRRFVAWALDGLVCLVWVVLLGEYRTGDDVFEASWQGWRFVLAFLVFPLAYFVLFEWLASATPGKFVVGIRVRRAEGGRIRFGQSVGRNLARVVDALPYVIPYVVGAVAVTRSSTRQRLGDRWANTVVILLGTDRPEPESESERTLERTSDELPPAPAGRSWLDDGTSSPPSSRPTDDPGSRLPPPPPAP
jgi:uncharacterized RDD family membrane protein YckC